MAKTARTELSRADMERIISKGESVMIGGQIISSLVDLPDTEESIAEAEAALEQRKAKAAGISEPAGEGETDLGNMTKPQLIEFAKANSIDVKVSAKVEEIRQVIADALDNEE